jgi:prepilin-type N-terminal cleavage/methylation domain-containing protein
VLRLGRRIRAVRSSDGGFGLVEVVISMFLFAIIAMAALPVLWNGMSISARNAKTATATQLAAKELEIARAAATSCASLRTFSTASPAPFTDAAGSSYSVQRNPVTCPTAFPTTVPYVSTVTSGGTSLASVTTKILVKQ